MKKIFYGLGMLVSISISSCNQSNSKSESSSEGTQLFEINGTKGNPKSVYLWITDKNTQDSTVLYTVKGLYQKDTVGFIVSLSLDLPPGIRHDGSIDETLGFQKGTVKFLKSGPESDLFVNAMSHIWALDSVVSNFSNQPVIPLTFSSNKTRVDHDKPSTSNFKLFFSPESNTPGEVFFSLDTYHRNIEIQEKDRKFAKTIINSLTGLE